MNHTTPQTRHTVVDSPYGPLTLVADDGVLCGLYMTEQRHRPPEESFGVRDDTGFAEPEEQLEAYFAGELKEFTLELRLHGTPFQRLVWEQLTRIPYGETRSYGDLAGCPRQPQGVPRGRPGQRQEPRGHHRPLPPCGRLRRQPHRIRRRRGAQAAPAGLRAGDRSLLRGEGGRHGFRASDHGSRRRSFATATAPARVSTPSLP